MNKINFEPIGQAMQAFDTDKIDIARSTEVENPDGTTGESSKDVPLYIGIPCHISFDQIDNANSNTTPTRPIVQILKISCAIDTDLQNGDLITAYKLASDGSTIETYIGVIGEPTSSMSRKTAKMEVRTNI